MKDQTAKPCSVELRTLSTFKYELTRLNSLLANSLASDLELSALKYMEIRVKEIEGRL